MQELFRGGEFDVRYKEASLNKKMGESNWNVPLSSPKENKRFGPTISRYSLIQSLPKLQGNSGMLFFIGTTKQGIVPHARKPKLGSLLALGTQPSIQEGTTLEILLALGASHAAARLGLPG